MTPAKQRRSERDAITEVETSAGTVFVWHGHARRTLAEAQAYRLRVREIDRQTAALIRQLRALNMDPDADS